ncbi:unnamed protein product [Acanthoscelides obtectus]|uniref:Serine/threonine-protein phosphatase PGAM5, mitochondrial n=1 Tax=Acanthoscelides obtectus TaxID=200917 RepID=A0A9P0K083_ACAOB|nr:unnamed protein product [Acanthoscelides obtectus]CAK1639039.1 Serine/threonine-protein phosphatase Pgam5, mitochondrial [Acanthoscelides obtectus]
MSFSKTKRLFLGLGALSGAATFYYLNNFKQKAHASWTTNYIPSSYAKWDDNWDHRAPEVLVKPKGNLSAKEENELNEKIEKQKSRAVRHIILIRHGQYVYGETDKDMMLTELGRIQADYSGKRLKELGFPYTNIIKSTMTRAQETGNIISESLPEVEVINCDLIREGAPIPPDPPIGSWKPERYKFYQDGSRIEAGFRKYFHRADPCQEKDSYHILVCHANVIRYFVCRALQFPAEAWLRLSLNHASITWISITLVADVF